MPKREAAKYQIKGNSESSSGIKRAPAVAAAHLARVIRSVCGLRAASSD